MLLQARLDRRAVWHVCQPLGLDDDGGGAGGEAGRLPGVAGFVIVDEEGGGEDVAAAGWVD